MESIIKKIPNCADTVDTIEIKPKSKITSKQQLFEVTKELGVFEHK
jgi:hypothetical protein